MSGYGIYTSDVSSRDRYDVPNFDKIKRHKSRKAASDFMKQNNLSKDEFVIYKIEETRPKNYLPRRLRYSRR